MALALVLSRQAADDLVGIRDYLIARNRVAADNVRAAIVATFTLHVDYVHAGRTRPELDCHSIPVARYPYT